MRRLCFCGGYDLAGLYNFALFVATRQCQSDLRHFPIGHVVWSVQVSFDYTGVAMCLLPHHRIDT
jgi:hypothetical protein